MKLCNVCDGSGEGRADGSRCMSCKGKGTSEDDGEEELTLTFQCHEGTVTLGRDGGLTFTTPKDYVMDKNELKDFLIWLNYWHE